MQQVGIAAIAIRPPTVPVNSSRVRFAVTSQHTIADLQWAIHHIIRIGKEEGFSYERAKDYFIPGWGMEEGVWTLVLPYFKEYSVQCINWRNVKEQSEFAGRIINVAKDENVILVGWSLGALAAVQAHKRFRQKVLY